MFEPFSVAAADLDPDERQRVDQRSQGLPQLVADHAIETLEPCAVTSDGLGVFGDEGVDGRLCENPDGLIQPAYYLHGLDSRGRQTQSRELFLNEGGENPTEQAVFGDKP